MFITSIFLHLMPLTKRYRQFINVLLWNFSRIRNPIKHGCYENCYGHTIYNLPFCIHVVPTMGFMYLRYFNLSVWFSGQRWVPIIENIWYRIFNNQIAKIENFLRKVNHNCNHLGIEFLQEPWSNLLDK